MSTPAHPHRPAERNNQTNQRRLARIVAARLGIGYNTALDDVRAAAADNALPPRPSTWPADDYTAVVDAVTVHRNTRGSGRAQLLTTPLNLPGLSPDNRGRHVTVGDLFTHAAFFDAPAPGTGLDALVARLRSLGLPGICVHLDPTPAPVTDCWQPDQHRADDGMQTPLSQLTGTTTPRYQVEALAVGTGWTDTYWIKTIYEVLYASLVGPTDGDTHTSDETRETPPVRTLQGLTDAVTQHARTHQDQPDVVRIATKVADALPALSRPNEQPLARREGELRFDPDRVAAVGNLLDQLNPTPDAGRGFVAVHGAHQLPFGALAELLSRGRAAGRAVLLSAPTPEDLPGHETILQNVDTVVGGAGTSGTPAT